MSLSRSAVYPPLFAFIKKRQVLRYADWEWSQWANGAGDGGGLRFHCPLIVLQQPSVARFPLGARKSILPGRIGKEKQTLMEIHHLHLNVQTFCLSIQLDGKRGQCGARRRHALVSTKKNIICICTGGTAIATTDAGTHTMPRRTLSSQKPQFTKGKQNQGYWVERVFPFYRTIASHSCKVWKTWIGWLLKGVTEGRALLRECELIEIENANTHNTQKKSTSTQKRYSPQKIVKKGVGSQNDIYNKKITFDNNLMPVDFKVDQHVVVGYPTIQVKYISSGLACKPPHYL